MMTSTSIPATMIQIWKDTSSKQFTILAENSQLFFLSCLLARHQIHGTFLKTVSRNTGEYNPT
jgi:hypothetical protein